MHPILFQYGFITIRYYGLMYVLGFLCAGYIAYLEIKRRQLGWDFEKFLDMMVYSFLLAILGARLYYVGFNWDYYWTHPADIIAVWKGGMAMHGGLIGGIGGLIVFSKRYGFDKWIVGDICCIGLILAQVFGRFGNFMNGDAHGYPTTLPWGVVFRPDTPAGIEFPGQALHPVMLYEMALDFIIFVILWKLRLKNFKKGFLGMMYLILYSVGRFFVCFLRADSLMLGPLRAAQVAGIIVVLVCGYIVWSRKMWQPD